MKIPCQPPQSFLTNICTPSDLFQPLLHLPYWSASHRPHNPLSLSLCLPHHQLNLQPIMDNNNNSTNYIHKLLPIYQTTNLNPSCIEDSIPTQASSSSSSHHLPSPNLHSVSFSFLSPCPALCSLCSSTHSNPSSLPMYMG